MNHREQNYTPFPSNDRVVFRPKMSENGKKCRKFPEVLGTFRGLQLVLLNSLSEPLAEQVNDLIDGCP